MLIGLLGFPQEVKDNFSKLSLIMNELNNKNRDSILTASRVLELEKEYAEYEKEFHNLFSSGAFKPNNHRASHIFRDVLLFGRPFNVCFILILLIKIKIFKKK